MALSGSQKAYLQARSGIARSGAIRSNYVFPLFGVVTVSGLDITKWIDYGSLQVTMALNEQPDTASFSVHLFDSGVQATLVVGADVVIGLGGPTENPLFGGRILTTQTTRGPARTPSVRSVMCADYLQVLDSEFLITYDWPAQSATTTIVDLITRFSGKAGGVVISTAGVAAGLPSHAAFGVANERFSTVLRRLVTMFPTGGGYYVDPLKVLHVWQGVSEPALVNPSPLTLDNPLVKAFAEVEDGSQERDAVIVEGRRTTAPIGIPDAPDPATWPLLSFPIEDASIFDPITVVTDPLREARIGTQRLLFAIADGVWSAPAATAQATAVTADVAFDPGAGGDVLIPVASVELVTGRSIPWVKIDEQYLKILGLEAGPSLRVPRTGFGALMGPIKAAAAVTVTDTITSVTVTDRYNGATREAIRAQPKDSDVVMTVRAPSATVVHEHLVQDGRYSRSGATARRTSEELAFDRPLLSIQFETDDLNAKPGRLQTYHLVEPPISSMAGEYMILTAALNWPVWGQPPRRSCTAADVHPATVTDVWLPDQR